MAETVLGAIPDARIKTGMLKSEAWVLVVTDQRLLAARLSDELKKQATEAAKAEAQASGAGFLGRLAARLRVGPALVKRYVAMAPEAILAETPGNWALSPGQVKAIKVERKSRSSMDDEGPEIRYLRITIETAGGKGTYDTDDETPSEQEARALLARVFGPVVR